MDHSGLIAAIEADFRGRLPGYHKSRGEGLSALAADRFYGTSMLIDWCQKAGWGYRIRLKGNLTLAHQGGELTTGEVITQCPEGVTDAELWGSGVITNIGTLHEKGHKEAWIICQAVTLYRARLRQALGH